MVKWILQSLFSYVYRSWYSHQALFGGVLNLIFMLNLLKTDTDEARYTTQTPITVLYNKDFSSFGPRTFFETVLNLVLAQI